MRMAVTGQDALEKLRIAVKALGVGKVAEAAGTPQTHLSTVLSGKRALGRETAARLRPILPDVPAEVWVELLAPIADADELLEAAP